eukprot:TRINITY_DN5337_c0_g1_i1.p1 TRINITY_DN5337_c0_g1~~TRINITY_DN5337_c0_g1_i1.p1  ORF type:complete len:115 (-),score=19.54 TRINITY_DN5337_c0_g1_i1:43-387(-)
MALRRAVGLSDGKHLMREDAMPCSENVKAFSGLGAVFGALVGWPLCFIHYGARITRPRILRWSGAGAAFCAASMAANSVLWEPACEPQNVAAYDSYLMSSFPETKETPKSPKLW